MNNNCFSIFTRSDLNRIRKETIKKRLVWLTVEFMREHEAVNSGCSKVRPVSSNMAKDSFNLFVSSFVSFCINGLKENAENLNYYPILRRKVELYLFLSTTVNEIVFFVASCKCRQQRLRSRWALFISKVLCLVNLLARTILENICLPLFSIN